MTQQAFDWLHPECPASKRRARRMGAIRVPRMATAMRLPQSTSEQLPLELASGFPHIFIHEGMRQTLERRLELAAGCPVRLGVTDNRRRMVTRTQERGALRVRLHMMFLDAPERIKEALVRYIARGDQDASLLVDAYIAANSFRIRAERPVLGPLKSRGRVHDLDAILRSLDSKYFGGAGAEVAITWGRRSSPLRESRTSIKLGTYSATERLIRIHPALDQSWVPRYFVAYIVFHEMLHHLLPPLKVGRVMLVHPPELLQRERAFRQYERAITWEKRQLPRLLRQR